MRPTQPLPTAAAEAIPTKATTAGEGFSLLILHTSEVLGEVNPCG
jgi:hypothetical protein